jgi:hypothetical protein
LLEPLNACIEAMKFVIALDKNVSIMFLFSHFKPSPLKKEGKSLIQSHTNDKDSKSVKNKRLNFHTSHCLRLQLVGSGENYEPFFMNPIKSLETGH